MKTLTNWYKTAQYYSGAKQGWILPNGSIVDVPPMGHEPYLVKNLAEFGIKELKNKYSSILVYDEAYRVGAVRFDIDTNHKEAGIAGYGQFIRKHIYTLMDLLAKYRVEKIYVDETDNPKKYKGK